MTQNYKGVNMTLERLVELFQNNSLNLNDDQLL